jgi:hypothetical protein
MPESNPDPSVPNSPKPEKKVGAFQIAAEPLVTSAEETEAFKYETGSVATESAPAASSPAFEDLGDLPESYFSWPAILAGFSVIGILIGANTRPAHSAAA